jgi:protein ImuB
MLRIMMVHAMSGSSLERRVVAIVLPELLCELAGAALHGPMPDRSAAKAEVACKQETRKSSVKRMRPLGVVLNDADGHARSNPDPAEEKPIGATALLTAVNAAACHFGVREGQSIAEACALVANLVVRELGRGQVLEELGRVAEMALGFGATAAIEAPDTVWLDVTGSAHLSGGEAALAAELCSRVRGMGHAARVAIADGPFLARAFARWGNTALGSREGLVIPHDQTVNALAKLPVVALPLDSECSSWLVRLGILTVGDLAALPRAAAAARLGDKASRTLDLCEGRDDTPLVVYQPARVLIEESSWEEPVTGCEPLLFVLRGLAGRLSARLGGRGEAAQQLVVTIALDPSIARLNQAEPQRVMVFELASPLWREEEIRRVVASRIERLKLGAPTLGMRLEVPSIVSALTRQLDLTSVVKGVLTSGQGVDELPVLLAELNADIGKDRVGVLKLLDSHRPEAKAALFPVDEALPQSRQRMPKKVARSLRKARPVAGFASAAPPTRLLSQPLPLRAALRVGATIAIERRLYTIEKLCFERRLDALEWWSQKPINRDYVRLWLTSPAGGLDALVYVDRETGARYLQAISD